MSMPCNFFSKGIQAQAKGASMGAMAGVLTGGLCRQPAVILGLAVTLGPCCGMLPLFTCSQSWDRFHCHALTSASKSIINFPVK